MSREAIYHKHTDVLPKINAKQIIKLVVGAGLTLTAVGMAIYARADNSRNVISPPPISQPFDAKIIPLPPFRVTPTRESRPIPTSTGESRPIPTPVSSVTPPAEIEQEMTNQGWKYSFGWTDIDGKISLFYTKGKEFKVKIITPTPAVPQK